jgi:AcrR family transcriptional regulator
VAKTSVPDEPERDARARVVAALVDAARRLFTERGPNRVSLREIAAAAGVNYGLIHQYVGTKDDLLALVFRTDSTDWVEQFRQAPTLPEAISWQMRPESRGYVRMLAHSILEGRDPARLLGRSPALAEMSKRLEREAPRADDDAIDPRIQAATLTCIVLGWQLFGPFLQHIAGMEDQPFEDVTAQVYGLVRQAVLPEEG